MCSVWWFGLLSLAGLGLGPVGAIFYRLSEFLSRSWESSEASSLADVEHNSAALETSAAKAWRSDRLVASPIDRFKFCGGRQF